METDECVRLLQGDDLAAQAATLKQYAKAHRQIVEEAVAALERSSAPAIVAEHIFNFGNILAPYIEQQLALMAPGEAKTALACALLLLNPPKGADDVLSALKRASQDECLAAITLAKAGIHDACPILLERLSTLAPEFYLNRKNAPYVTTLLLTLHRLGGELPSALRERFTASEVPRELVDFVKSDFARSS